MAHLWRTMLTVGVLLFGALLAIAVLLLFLRSIRSTLVVAVAIPISIKGRFLYRFSAFRAAGWFWSRFSAFAVKVFSYHEPRVLFSVHRKRVGVYDALVKLKTDFRDRLHKILVIVSPV